MGNSGTIRIKQAVFDLFLKAAVCHSDTLVLAQVLQPGFHHKALQETLGSGGVMKQFPEESTVPALYPAHRLHKCKELLSLCGVDEVFQRHQYRTPLGFRFSF